MAFWLLWLLIFWRGNGPQGNLEIRIASKRNSIFALGQTEPVHKMLAISNRQSANNKDFKLIGSFNAEKNHYNNNDDDWWLLARSFVRPMSRKIMAFGKLERECIASRQKLIIQKSKFCHCNVPFSIFVSDFANWKGFPTHDFTPLDQWPLSRKSLTKELGHGKEKQSKSKDDQEGQHW